MKPSFRLSVFALFTGLFFLSIAGVAPGAQSSGTPSTGKKAAAKTGPSDQEIADARSKGMVWVNTSTHVYHKDGSSMYGKTKRGRFMTEEDAKKAGYRAANEAGSPKKHTASASGTSKQVVM